MEIETPHARLSILLYGVHNQHIIIRKKKIQVFEILKMLNCRDLTVGRKRQRSLGGWVKPAAAIVVSLIL